MNGFMKKLLFFLIFLLTIFSCKVSKAPLEETHIGSNKIVVINSVKDNSPNTIFKSAGGTIKINEKFQQTLTQELAKKYAARYNARIYTQQQAIKENLQPDWVVDITLTDLSITAPSSFISQKDVTIQEPAGRDSSGNILYTTSYGTIDTETQTFYANGQMEIIITEVSTGKAISTTSLRNSYKWENKIQSSLGDRKALYYANQDPSKITSINLQVPAKEVILYNIYQRFYPDFKKT